MKLTIRKINYTDTEGDFINTFISDEIYSGLERINIKRKSSGNIVVSIARHGHIDEKRIFTKDIKIEPQPMEIYPEIIIESEKQ